MLPDIVNKSFIMYSSEDSGSLSLEAEEEQYQCLQKMKLMAALTMANIVTTAALIYANPLYNKIPYHTSALSGANWVLELLNSHPEHIHNELGIHKHVFYGLIDELKIAGHRPSKNVYLEDRVGHGYRNTHGVS